MDASASDIAARIASDSSELRGLTISLFIASLIVLIGLLWEDWPELKQLYRGIRLLRSDRRIAQQRPELSGLSGFQWPEMRKIVTKLLAASLVVLGIGAELVFQFEASKTENDLQDQYGIEIADEQADNEDLNAVIQPRHVVLQIGPVRVMGGNLISNISRFLKNAEEQLPKSVMDMKQIGAVPVSIQVVPDMEAEKLASEIAGFVEILGWTPQFVNESATGLLPMDIQDGVRITSWRGEIPFPDASTAVTPEDKSAVAADMLTQYFDSTSFNCLHPRHKRNADGLQMYPYMKVVPADGIFISVGMKPIEVELAIKRSEREVRKELEKGGREFNPSPQP
jgi:hypothetical protein